MAEKKEPTGGYVNKKDHYVPYYPPAAQEESLIQTLISHPVGALGMFATVGVLAGGLYSFLQGNDPLKSNKMMQRRVLAQFGTVSLICGGLFWMTYGRHLVPKKEEKVQQ